MPKASAHARALNGAALYQARIKQGLTQAEIAARVVQAGCYMSDSRVSQFELGKAPHPSPKIRAALGRAYGLGEDEMTVPCGTCGQEWSPGCIDHGTEAASTAKVA